MLLLYTNLEVNGRRENYENMPNANLSNDTLSVLNTLFGVWVLAATSKDNQHTLGYFIP